MNRQNNSSQFFLVHFPHHFLCESVVVVVASTGSCGSAEEAVTLSLSIHRSSSNTLGTHCYESMAYHRKVFDEEFH